MYENRTIIVFTSDNVSVSGILSHGILSSIRLSCFRALDTPSLRDEILRVGSVFAAAAGLRFMLASWEKGGPCTHGEQHAAERGQIHHL